MEKLFFSIFRQQVMRRQTSVNGLTCVPSSGGRPYQTSMWVEFSSFKMGLPLVVAGPCGCLHVRSLADIHRCCPDLGPLRQRHRQPPGEVDGEVWGVGHARRGRGAQAPADWCQDYPGELFTAAEGTYREYITYIFIWDLEVMCNFTLFLETPGF